ncbi:MAG: hypothetical protein U5K29_03055 [Acidimicrobiales bacterium]|nr:hypothetical protein [Acidimicrobiales bacterium]
MSENWPAPTPRDEMLSRVVVRGRRIRMVNRLLIGVAAAAATAAGVAGLALGASGTVSFGGGPVGAAVAGDGVTYFACPNTGAVGELHDGDRVYLTGQDDSGDWVQVRSPLTSTSRVWIRGELVDPDEQIDLPVATCSDEVGELALVDPTVTTTTTAEPVDEEPDEADGSTTTSTVAPTTTATTAPATTTTVAPPPPTTTTAPTTTTTSTTTTTTAPTTTTTTAPAPVIGQISESPGTIREVDAIAPSTNCSSNPTDPTTSTISLGATNASTATMSWSVGGSSGSKSMTQQGQGFSAVLGPFGESTIPSGSATIQVTIEISGPGGTDTAQTSVQLLHSTTALRVMTMNQRTLILLSVVAGLALFSGGLVLGNVVRSDAGEDPASPNTVPIATAAPVLAGTSPGATEAAPDPVSPYQRSGHQIPLDLPSTGGDPDGPADASTAGPSTGSPDAAGTEEGEPSALAERIYGPERGIDSDGEGEIYEPPTTPSEMADADDADPDGDGADPGDAEGAGDGSDGDLVGVDLEELLAEEWPVDLPRPRLEEPRFSDPCAAADADEDACPAGMGGTITLLDHGEGTPDPLSISAQLYETLSVSGVLRCDDLGMGDDGIYRAVFASNNPADFTIRHWPSGSPDEAQELSYRTPDSERDWWAERHLAGEPTWANPHGGVQNCPEIPGLAHRHTTVEIHGVDDFGTEDTARIFFTPPRGGSGETPRTVTFTPRRDPVHGILAAPYKSDSESVYMASIPKNGPRGSERSCTDIEADMLDGRHRSDLSLVDVRDGTLARRPGDDSDPDFDRVAVGRVFPEEGTTYDLCVWITVPGPRSFDRPTVIERESFTVRAPRALRVRIWATGGFAIGPLDAYSVRVAATNWRDGYGPGRTFPDDDLPSGPFTFDERVLMTGSGSSKVPATTLLEITGPSGWTSTIDVPTPTRCPMLGFFECPTPGSDEYRVPIPLMDGRLSLVVERYAGPGGPPDGNPLEDGWQVRSQGDFDPAEPEGSAELPRIDGHRSFLRTRPGEPGEAPGMTMRLEFDRPVRVEATPHMNFVGDCGAGETQTTDDFRSSVQMFWEELCWGGAYSVGLLAVDEEGNELDLRAEVDGTPTGDVGWGYVVLPGFTIEEFTVGVTIDRLGDGIRPQSIGGTVGGVSIGAFAAPGREPRCQTDVDRGRQTNTVPSDGGVPITWRDPVTVYLQVAGAGDGRDCGLDDGYVAVTLRQEVPLDELLAGPVTLTYDEADAQITVEIIDVVAG